MKKLAAAFLFFGLLVSSPAQAAEGNQTGLYVGAKLGMSIERFSNTQFGMDPATVSGGGMTASWGHIGLGLPNQGDSVFGGGLSVGYDFKKRLNIPLRLELDYTLRANASDESSNTGLFTGTMNNAPFAMESTVLVKSSVRLQTMMLNAWFDIPTGTKFTPYLGGGIGVALIRHKSTAIENPGTPDQETVSNSKSFSNFAWSLGAGLAYNINDNWTVDLGYRYINAGEHKINYSGDENYLYSKLGKIHAHDIMLGIRYTF